MDDHRTRREGVRCVRCVCLCVSVHESNQEHQNLIDGLIKCFFPPVSSCYSSVFMQLCKRWRACLRVRSPLNALVFVETEKGVGTREEWVLCVHCSVTKWEWNGTAGLKKREDWISAKHGPLGQRVKERQRDGGRERGTHDAGSQKKAIKPVWENCRETGKWGQRRGRRVKGKEMDGEDLGKQWVSYGKMNRRAECDSANR